MKSGFTRALPARGLLVTVVAAGVLAGGGAAAYAAASHDGDGDDRGGTAPRITAAQAADAALKAAPGLVQELELDDGDHGDNDGGGRTVWEADVLAADGTWRAVTVDAGSGKVVGNKTARHDGGDGDGDGDGADDGDGDGDDRPAAVAASLKNAKVTAAQATGIALKRAPGTVTSVEFGRHWEVEVVRNGAERELKIDPASGAVRAVDDED